ncbi:norA [Symbiodinium natans]|uniref:NorA protein n=1 Tax=Symbiodinium natans TaxID=878477 RepID=A0A812S452_9DINO|nr:norA [Symbiodinium natans]
MKMSKGAAPQKSENEPGQESAVAEPENFTTVVGAGGLFHKQQSGVSAVSYLSAISETFAEIREAGPLLLTSLCLVSALEGADMALLPAVFYALQTDLGLHLNDLATMTLIQGVTSSAVAPFWGIIADRGIMKRKTIIIMGCILQGLVTMMLSVVDQMVGMTLLRALNGALLASLRPVANGVIADVTSEQRRGKVYGFVQLCANVGLMAGGLIGTPLSTQLVWGWQGWRISFIGIGSLSVLVGLFAACTMTEPERENSGKSAKERGALRQELGKLLSYFRMPTFCALIFQGWFGSIPWNAMGYSTLFYQVGGIGDAKAAILAAVGQASGAIGGLLGGLIGDRLSKCCPMHGRPFTAQVSVLCGIPVAYCIFMIEPPEGEAAFYYYMGLTTFMGLTATWCGVGVNLPILTEIVRPEGRSTILAWEAALESTFAAILGNAMVGFLAQNVFGYKIDEAHKDAVSDPESRRALGKALTLTCFTPWLICWLAYTLLHWSYPKDLKRVRDEKMKDRKEARMKKQQEREEAKRAAREAGNAQAHAEASQKDVDMNVDEAGATAGTIISV